MFIALWVFIIIAGLVGICGICQLVGWFIDDWNSPRGYWFPRHACKLRERQSKAKMSEPSH
jgi:hypothetical protein